MANQELLEDVQSMWQVPALSHSVELFRSILRVKKNDEWGTLPEFSVESLEGWLACEDLQPQLVNIHVNLLHGLGTAGAVSTLNWEETLRVEMNERMPEYINPLDGTEYRWISVQDKVYLLHTLLEWRMLDAVDSSTGGKLNQALKEIEPDSLRVDPLGYDRLGNAYWYFSGIRLYREGSDTTKPKKLKKSEAAPLSSLSDGFGTWDIVCEEYDDWVELVKELKCRKASEDQFALYKLLKDEFLPGIEEMQAKEERRRKREEWLNAPRRQSSRQVALEEKRKIQEQQEQERREEEERKREEQRKRAAEQAAIRKEKAREERALARQAAIAKRLEQRNQESEEADFSWYPKAEELVQQIKQHESAWPFLEPVTEEVAPSYFDVIDVPMDLSTISESLEKKQFHKIEQFEEDMMLIFKNCRSYNDSTTIFYDLANKTQTFFKSKFRRAFPDYWKTRTAQPDDTVVVTNGHPAFDSDPEEEKDDEDGDDESYKGEEEDEDEDDDDDESISSASRKRKARDSFESRKSSASLGGAAATGSRADLNGTTEKPNVTPIPPVATSAAAAPNLMQAGLSAAQGHPVLTGSQIPHQLLQLQHQQVLQMQQRQQQQQHQQQQQQVPAFGTPFSAQSLQTLQQHSVANPLQQQQQFLLQQQRQQQQQQMALQQQLLLQQQFQHQQAGQQGQTPVQPNASFFAQQGTPYAYLATGGPPMLPRSTS